MGERRAPSDFRRAWRGLPCTCDIRPETCAAHPFAPHAMLDDGVCEACGARGDNHARRCDKPPVRKTARVPK